MGNRPRYIVQRYGYSDTEWTVFDTLTQLYRVRYLTRKQDAIGHAKLLNALT